MKKTQIKDEHYKLIESIVKDSPLYEDHEDLLDVFIETIYKKSYLLIDSIHDLDRLTKHLIAICDESIEQVLKEVKEQTEESFKEEGGADDSDFFLQTRSIVFENQNDDETLNQLEDPIEKYPNEKINKDSVEKLINAVRIADSKYPEKEFYKFFSMRYIKKYDLTEIARTMNLSQAELSKRFTELINTAKEYIKEQMVSKEGEQYIRSEVSNDLKSLYATGYFTKNLRALPIKVDENNIKLRVIVEENPPVHGFVIIGNNSVATSDIMAILEPYERQPQNILSLNNAISEIQNLYSSRGYVVAKVTKVTDDPDGYVYIYIDEGIIGDIIVEGNSKTKDFIVKRNIFLQPGYVYNENIMRSDILRLMGTQAFKDVQREVVQDESTGLYDVYIMLEEQRTGKISVGVGIDSASGFFGSVGFSENNFRGLGQKLNLNLLAGTGILMNDSSIVRKPTFQGEISFLEPFFKRENQSLALRGFARYYGSYQVPLAIERRFGAEATISRRFITHKNLSGSISFGAEHISLEEGNEKQIMARYLAAGEPWSQRAEELDGGFYVKVTPALTYDTRDSVVNARKGLLARVSLEENIGLGASSYGKVNALLRKYMGVGKKSSFVVTAKAGGKLHGDMPEFGAYALGGPYTIRGFNISEVGVGDGYVMGSAELRVPIPFIDRLTSNSFLNNLRLAAFVDAGTLFNQTIGSRIYDKPGYAISAGIGLRVFIPGLGPINLDYGIPLTNTYAISRGSGFFTFGMGEMY